MALQMRTKRGAVHEKAQVDKEGGNKNNKSRGVGADELQAHKLRGTGKDDQGHADPFGGSEVDVNGRYTRNQRKRHHTQQNGQVRFDPIDEFSASG